MGLAFLLGLGLLLPVAAWTGSGTPVGFYDGKDAAGAAAAGYSLVYASGDWSAMPGPVVPWSNIDISCGACGGTAWSIPDSWAGGPWSAAVTLPFAFTFYGQPYTTMKAHGTGMLGFGSPPPPDGNNWDYLDYSSAGSSSKAWAVIFPFWSDSQHAGCSAGSLAPTAHVKYKSVPESSPGANDRIFVVQYTDSKFTNGGSCGGTMYGGSTYQVRLYQSGNVIEVHYKAVTNADPYGGADLDTGLRSSLSPAGTPASPYYVRYSPYYVAWGGGSMPGSAVTSSNVVQYRPPGVKARANADSYTFDYGQYGPGPYKVDGTAYGPQPAFTKLTANDKSVASASFKSIYSSALTGGTLQSLAASTCSGASPVISTDGSFCFTPAAGNPCGTYTFKYHDTDAWASSTDATVTINVVNCLFAIADAYAAVEDTPLTIAATAPAVPYASGASCAAGSGLLCNDYDPLTCAQPTPPTPCYTDGTPYTFHVVTPVATPPTSGVLTSIASTGAFTYTPNANFCGVDTFQYRITDNTATSGPGLVTITVACMPDLPVANPDSWSLADGTSITVPAATGVRANDFDIDGMGLPVGQLLGDPVVLVTPPAQISAPGDFSLGAGGNVYYKPTPGFHGTDCFTYKLQDDGFSPAQFSNNAQGCFTVLPVPPVATGDSYTVPMGLTYDTVTQGAPSILANDADLDDADPLTVDLATVSAPAVAPPANLVVKADGSFQYTGPPSWTGTDSFTYRAKDSFGLLSGFVTVTLDVVPNVPPDAAFDASTTSAQTNEQISFTDKSFDVDGTVTSWTWKFGDGFSTTVKDTQHAFSSPGTYQVCLTVTDNWGAVGTKCVTITVGDPAGTEFTGGTGGSDPPVAYAGPDMTVVEGKHAVLHGSINGGAANIYQWTQAAGVPVVLNNATTADLDFVAPMLGSATALVLEFELRVNDGHMDSLPDRVQVTVVSANHVPVAKAGGAIQRHAGEIVTLDGSASSDPDGDALTYKWTSAPGTMVTLTGADGAKPHFEVPAAAIGQTLVFTLEVSDGKATNLDSVQVLVTAKPYDGPGFTVQPGPNGTVSVAPALAGSYLWDFGDVTGAVVSSGPATHAYGASGSYTIRLTIRGADGSTRTFAQEVSVDVPEAPGGTAADQGAASLGGQDIPWAWLAAAGAFVLLVGLGVFLYAWRRA